MLGHLLSEAGADPLVMVGGAVDRLGQQGSRIGKSEVFVAEVDESDGGFELVEPNLAIVTNLDAEHLRHYGSFESLCAAFRRWLGRLGPQGTAIVPVRGLPEQVTRNLDCTILRCGLGEGEVSAVDIEAGSEGSSFRVIWLGQDLGRISIRIPGIHMILNALMAIAAARTTLPDCPIQTLATCERVGRRFTVHGTPRGIRVVEDYGHHPTEVQATIAAACLAGGPVHVAFQPHRYTRTQDCFDAFCQCFDQAASLVLLPVYAASETPIPGASSEALAAAIRARRQANGLGPASCDLATKDDDATDLLCQRAQRGDTVLILGAGDIGRMAPRLTAALDGRRRTQE
jgi:UDP-N-acetylmuramate--alanine ligase